jgi:Domain of unknown function (DUF4168)
MYNKLFVSIVTACVLGIMCLMPAMAQDQANPQITYSNEKLKSFIIANSGIHQLQKQAFSQMGNIESEQQKQEIARKTNQQIVQVFQETGLTVDEYTEIDQAIQTDSQLQDKVQAIASELDQSQQGQER